MEAQFAIVDLFAGPGGLAEGFASIQSRDGSRPFRIALSIEKEASAFETLRLRNFLRQFEGELPDEYYAFLNEGGPAPNWSKAYSAQWKRACLETARLELGSRRCADEINARLSRISHQHGGNVILIGGPPCQAYSLVGRARNKGKEGYEPRQDKRHFLYREYIRILEKLMPAAFVMENVKGLLSSSIDGVRIFDKVLDDLSAVGDGAYKLVPLSPRSGRLLLRTPERHPPAADFVVRTEEHGIPQARHRVIIVGIRSDIADALGDDIEDHLLLPVARRTVRVQDVLSGMPRLRSGLSKGEDSETNWQRVTSRLMRTVAQSHTGLSRDHARMFRRVGKRLAKMLSKAARISPRSGGSYEGAAAGCPDVLRAWLVDSKLRRCPNHETRGHMPSDLGRYFFAALYARMVGSSPKASNFPRALAPDHRNWRSGKFADRFRVQLWKAPATTVTSHIAKDGHYFIHPDPSQCRSLTVREAARLQTFPDNYFFMGNRTQQYTQVGNAVPPFLARQMAACLYSALREWQVSGGRRTLKKAS